MDSNLIEITMPSLGSDMTEGTLVEWLVHVGDRVKKGDIIAVIETQKGAIDMEVYQSGIVAEIVVQPVVKVPVGTLLARLQATEAVPAPKVVTTATPKAETTAMPKAEIAASSKPAPVSVQSAVKAAAKPAMDLDKKPAAVPLRAGVVASPAARKRAAEQKINLSAISGSGPAGAILLRDLVAVKGAPKAAAFAEKAEKMTPAEAMRAAIASAMERSKKEIPHYYIALDIDITAAQQWLQQVNAGKEPEQRTLLLAVMLRAVARSLAKFPQLNGYYVDGQFQPGKAIHIGNVISLREGGLLVPAIHDVDQLTVEETMLALKDVSDRSRTGHLRTSELTDATITVTSMGERGCDSVFGVIYPPQVAIIGLGKARRAAVVKDETVVICDMMTATLSADHRVSDGIVGAKFLNILAKNLQQPESL